MRKHFILATRGSRLALWQANYIKECLERIDPEVVISLNTIKTKGDIILDVPLARVGGKGLFVKEIEQALLDGRADLAVHSVKDVPMDLPEGLILGCVPKREACTDCFLSMRYPSIEELPARAVVGTSSLRRQAQLLAKRPDLQIKTLRGNIETRLGKLRADEYDAIILATAGMFRLELRAPFMVPLDVDDFLPAVGQGALGVECTEDNYELLVLLAHLEDSATRVCVDAERSFLAALDGGCQVPIAAHAEMIDDDNLALQGLVGETDGSVLITGRQAGHTADAARIGSQLGNELLENGARDILLKLYS